MSLELETTVGGENQLYYSNASQEQSHGLPGTVYTQMKSLCMWFFFRGNQS